MTGTVSPLKEWNTELGHGIPQLYILHTECIWPKTTPSWFPCVSPCRTKWSRIVRGATGNDDDDDVSAVLRHMAWALWTNPVLKILVRRSTREKKRPIAGGQHNMFLWDSFFLPRIIRLVFRMPESFNDYDVCGTLSLSNFVTKIW